MNILGLVGQANSGKDTVANHLVSNHGYKKVSLADPIKRFGKAVFGFTDTQLWGPSEYRNRKDPRFDYFCNLRPGGKRFTSATQLGNLFASCDSGWLYAAKKLNAHAVDWVDQVIPGGDIQSLYDWLSALGNNHARLSPRVMLQHLGTEWGREIMGKDIWVNCMLKSAQRVLQGQQYDYRVGFTGKKSEIPRGIVVSDIRFCNELSAVSNISGSLVLVRRPATDEAACKIGIEGHASEVEQKKFSLKNFDAIIYNIGKLDSLKHEIDRVLKSWE